MEKLREQLLVLVAPVAQKFALDLVDLELKGSKNNLIVRAIVDKDGGIGVDACAALSRALADEFDTRDAIPGKYRLEVSSPGLDRPLRSRRDFQRHLGREVVVRWRAGEDMAETEGIIHAVGEAEIEIATPGENRKIPLAELELGKLKIKW